MRIGDATGVGSKVVSKDGCALEYIHPSLINAPLVLAAVRQNGLACVCNFRPERPRGCRRRRGEAEWVGLRHASKRLRAKRRIVLTAVRSSGAALEFADDKWKDDEKVVLEESQPMESLSSTRRCSVEPVGGS